ncbi:DUF4153 domain-containing protein [Escherichia marmotae]|jgi:hypothetical protein|uniref:DUF4153 domain-containing protein n=2 Tax=Escherichia TaxID=561 RepID=A0A370VCA0_9ESCH|nr:DUF4153 domain-containing protein [Escherichia marmotae]MBE1768648.1 DUF4153 domain-containing protein [Escherichia marmotae]MCE5355637.1 DUF4153 domain-containing protein [Escherichia marmotae]MCE5384777.1 DUF4153 domain-containing protein [Escherichia marmotae]MDQ9228018.1 DUF4153 domain-containing protein [Escherichia marmotae]MDQ9232931.1 DUF4153 domain-containing protein [Escherichia marmotae]
MDNVELSPVTRWGMVATGLLQGLVCYLLITWLAGKNNSWIVYGVPATLAFSSVLLFTVVSFKQKRLWGWLAIVLIATLGMSGWLKWQIDGMSPWRAEKALWDFGCYLLLMGVMLLPWIQQSLRVHNDITRYSYFYQSVWHNVLVLLVIFITNGLTWLVLLLWSELFKLVGITFFKTLFFSTDWFIYLTLGLVTALAVILARTQSRLIDSIQKLFTLIATGLLPLVSLLTLLFIITLPFAGLNAISRHISAAGLLLTLAFLQLLLMAVVRDPQKASIPWAGPLRYLIKTALLVTPLYVLIAAWALWLRVAQYDWTAERLHGALAVVVLLVWSLGYFVSIVWRKGQNPLVLQGKVNLAVSLLVLVILVLLNSPVLDSMRISVNSHMARYQSGKNTPDQVSIYMLEQSGRYGRTALESLKSDVEYMKDPKRRRSLLMAFDGVQRLQQRISEKALADNVLIAPGSGKPDATFWSAVMKNLYNAMICIEKDACVLVEQDLNSDGRAEGILFAFNSERYIVYGFDPDKKEWQELTMSLLPREITKEKLLTAAKEGKLGTKPKAWRDLTVDGETLDLNLNE